MVVKVQVLHLLITAIAQGKQVTQVSQISKLKARKMLMLSWSDVIETTIANQLSEVDFSKNVNSQEDDPFSKLKESLHQLQQHDKDFISEDSNS